jgi:hypothetical protein
VEELHLEEQVAVVPEEPDHLEVQQQLQAQPTQVVEVEVGLTVPLAQHH